MIIELITGRRIYVAEDFLPLLQNNPQSSPFQQFYQKLESGHQKILVNVNHIVSAKPEIRGDELLEIAKTIGNK